MKKSIDKCSGPDCACVIAAGFREIKKLIIEPISLNNGPSIFPGVDRATIFVGPPGAMLPSALVRPPVRDRETYLDYIEERNFRAQTGYRG